MSSIVKRILFKAIPEADHKGRLVRFDKEKPNFDLFSGTIRNRIVFFLSQQTAPVTIKLIAQGIRSTSGRVSHFMVDLVEDGVVKSLRSKGSPTEFILANIDLPELK
jgi:hypothetical protein